MWTVKYEADSYKWAAFLVLGLGCHNEIISGKSRSVPNPYFLPQKYRNQFLEISQTPAIDDDGHLLPLT